MLAGLQIVKRLRFRTGGEQENETEEPEML